MQAHFDPREGRPSSGIGRTLEGRGGRGGASSFECAHSARAIRDSREADGTPSIFLPAPRTHRSLAQTRGDFSLAPGDFLPLRAVLDAEGYLRSSARRSGRCVLFEHKAGSRKFSLRCADEGCDFLVKFEISETASSKPFLCKQISSEHTCAEVDQVIGPELEKVMNWVRFALSFPSRTPTTDNNPL